MPIQQPLLFDFDNEPLKPGLKENSFVEEQQPLPGENTVEINEAIVDLAVEASIGQNIVTPKTIAGTGKKIGRGRLKMSELEAISDLVEIPGDAELFSKKYYTIGAVAEMFKVNVSLIRFWENEFSALKPKKNGKGDRLFRPEDVKTLKLIHHLLREKKFTIDGAKDFLKKNKRAEANFEIIETLKKTKQFLTEIKLSL